MSNDGNFDEQARPPTRPDDDCYFTITEALDELRSLNFKVSKRQVERWAEYRRLPFFRFGRCLYIEKKELRASFKRMQLTAVRKSRAAD